MLTGQFMSKIKGDIDLFFTTHRLGYGLRAEDYEPLFKQGHKAWLEEQLTAPVEDEAPVKSRLDTCKLPIKYAAVEGKWPTMDELRPLRSLSKPIEELWPLFDPQKPVSGAERARPRTEVIAATLLRSVYSRYQLKEVISQFWHDHFHVNAFSDERISVALPVYDRDVIRKNCFGNFRVLLEAVATSTAMQFYLSNYSSRAGAANENYARELLELHTFGRENYLNDNFNRWREVPGALKGQPIGYIDQDVYEVARAFTGWTIAETGRFNYVERWHDGYQKRVLAKELAPFAPAMADGREVLDLIAVHPATAQHMATKLCIRLVGENPTASLITRAAATWQSTHQAPDQIAKVLRLIIESPEFMQSRGAKIKRPIALMANYVRVMGFDFTPSEGLINQLTNAGQRLFGATTPVGLPDENAIFLGTNTLRHRWALLLGLAQNQWGTGTPNLAATFTAWKAIPGNGTETITELFRLMGNSADSKTIETVTMAAGLLPFAPPVGKEKNLILASAIAAMSPDFQFC